MAGIKAPSWPIALQDCSCAGAYDTSMSHQVVKPIYAAVPERVDVERAGPADDAAAASPYVQRVPSRRRNPFVCPTSLVVSRGLLETAWPGSQSGDG